MRNLMLIFCTLLIIISCAKEKDSVNNDNTPATFITKDYDSLVLKSYSSSYWEDLSGGYTYLAFMPPQNIVSDSIDIDEDMIMDYKIQIRHSVFSYGPHYALTEILLSINSLDTNYSVGVKTSNGWADVREFHVGDTINNVFIYSGNGVIVDASAEEYTKNNKGNIYLGLRKRTGTDMFNYGYLNLFVKMAEVTLIKSVLNTNKDKCIVE
jgi:hypothetical protein